MEIKKKKKCSTLFIKIECLFSFIPWILLAIAIYILFRVHNNILHDLSLSYIAGMIVYLLTVVIPDVTRNMKLKRYVISDLATLYKDYRDLIKTISDQPSDENPYPFTEVRKGLERFNCRRQSAGICLSNRMIDIIKPKCEKIISDTSLLLSKDSALSVNELLVIHEITQVWFLRDIISLEDGSDYYQSKKEMMLKADYLVQRFNQLQSLYFKIKRQIDLTVGLHPVRKKNNRQ